MMMFIRATVISEATVLVEASMIVGATVLIGATVLRTTVLRGRSRKSE
jgi:hypothetical protein